MKTKSGKQMKYEDNIRKKYPIETIDSHFKKIEELGYTVIASEEQCLIWDNDKLIIDADFFDDYHTNAADAINAFYS